MVDLGLLIVRLVGGTIMVAHGLPKWPNRARVAARWEEGGIPFGRVAVFAAYVVEVPVGVMYMAGLLTGWASLLSIVFLAVGTWWSICIVREPFVSQKSKGYDVNLALLTLFLLTALAGGGSYSLDGFLGVSPYWPSR